MKILIESFNDMYDAILFLETHMELGTYLKGEIYKTPDHRYRVSLSDKEDDQIEMYDWFKDH